MLASIGLKLKFLREVLDNTLQTVLEKLQLKFALGYSRGRGKSRKLPEFKLEPGRVQQIVSTAQLDSLKAISVDHLHLLLGICRLSLSFSLPLFLSLPCPTLTHPSRIPQLQLQLSGNCYKVLSPHKASRSQEWSHWPKAEAEAEGEAETEAKPKQNAR